MELWKTIPDYPDYEASEAGRVRRTKATRGGPAYGLLFTWNNAYGYPLVKLWKDGKCKVFLLHRQIAATFIGPAPAKHEVNHKNGKRDDASLTNLEYVTRSQNNLHAYRVLGRKPIGFRPNDPKLLASVRKLTPENVSTIRATPLGKGKMKALADRFGVALSTVYSARYAKNCWKNEPAT